MGRILTVIVYFLGAAILVSAVAYLLKNEPANSPPVAEAVQPVDQAGKDESIDMSHLIGGQEGLQKRRIERAMLEARYQQERAAMAGESEEEIARLDRRHRYDREDMRERHEREAAAEAAQAEAAAAGQDN